MRYRAIFLIICGICGLVISACTSTPKEADQAAGDVHPASWAATHQTEADADGDHCKVCHGDDLTGGSAGVSCFSCHIAGPPFTSIHPWTPVIDGHKTFAESSSWTTCANAVCHGTSLRGGSIQESSTGPSCFTSACHASGPPAPHTTPYTDPADHGAAARSNLTWCRNCHGRPDNDFTGGIVADNNIVNNANGNCASCHTQATAHPTNWQGINDDTDPTYDSSHRGVGQTNISSNCALCHLTTGPGTGPMSTAPSCYTGTYTNPDGSSNTCHVNGPQPAPHTVGSTWINDSEGGSHEDSANSEGLSYCQQCHGNPESGPDPTFDVAFTTYDQGCETCHNAGLSSSYATCASCHNSPPDGLSPAGDFRPNRAGAHAVHDALAAVNGNCAICHENAGHNTSNHYDDSEPATISIQAAYNEQGATATFDSVAGTCAGVRCHGGQDTPGWWSGSINVDTDCLNCHEVYKKDVDPTTIPYNAANSGEHDKHVNGKNAGCTECHDTGLLSAVHFDDLSDTDVGTNAAATINLNDNGNTPSSSGELKYDPATGDCYLTCHAPFNKDHDPKNWW